MVMVMRFNKDDLWAAVSAVLFLVGMSALGLALTAATGG